MKDMKGLSLPTETLVVIIVAIIVLLALVALFLGGWGGATVIDAAGAKSKACAIIVTSGCSDKVWSNKVPLTDKFCNHQDSCTVQEVCSNDKIGLPDQDACYKSCGCPNGAI
ncbi:MAG: hypothetical protein V1944_00280 [Candidatus Aenigmatarchaeota archaeon]